MPLSLDGSTSDQRNDDCKSEPQASEAVCFQSRRSLAISPLVVVPVRVVSSSGGTDNATVTLPHAAQLAGPSDNHRAGGAQPAAAAARMVFFYD